MLQDTLDFLHRLRIFADLREEELYDLAQLCKRYTYRRGAIIAYQRDVADRLYIVRSGRLEAFEVDDAGVVARARRYLPGDYFEDEWLFAPGVHRATVRAAADGELLSIRQADFVNFIDTHPDAVLELSPTAWETVDRMGGGGEVQATINRLSLLPGEIVEFESRRTGLLLVLGMGGPLLAAVGLLIGYFALRIGVTGLRGQAVLLGFLALFELIAMGWALYNYLDWYNDYLVVTNKHLVHKEFNLRTFAGEIQKIPLDQLQSMRVLRPSLLETILGLGTIQVTTASATRGLSFNHIRRPELVEQTVNRVRSRERVLDESRARKAVRQSLEQYFRVPEDTRPIADSDETAPAAKPRGRAKRRGPRTEEGDTITYGRHWFVIIERAWWAILLLLLTAGALLVGGRYIPALSSGPALLAAGVLLFIELFVIFYYYENWRNDIFQVSRDMVIDVDRGPFGFTESRKTAPLNNVQDVRSRIPNLIATILGYGDVLIDTAGASSNIIFEDVYDPNGVQAEIFRRRDQLRELQRTRDAVSRRQELVLMLDEYQQLQEQERIPRRTPPLDATVPDDPPSVPPAV